MGKTEKQKDSKGNCALMDFKDLVKIEENTDTGMEGRNEKRWGASRASKLPGKSLLSGRICTFHGVFMVCGSCVSRVLHKQCLCHPQVHL